MRFKNLLCCLLICATVLMIPSCATKNTTTDNPTGTVIPASRQNESEHQTEASTTDDLSFSAEVSPADLMIAYGVKWSFPGDVNAEENIVIYNGEPIVLNALYDNHSDREIEMGLCVTLNGVRQVYSADIGGVETEDNTLLRFMLPPKDVLKLSIAFSPNVGSAGDQCTLLLSDMLYPSYFVKTEDPSQGYAGAFLGHDFSAKLIMRVPPANTIPICNSFDAAVTEIDPRINSLNYREGPNGEAEKIQPEGAGIWIYQHDTSEVIDAEERIIYTDLKIGKSEEEPLTLSLVGEPGQYRVSFFVDHNAVPCFNGNEYLDTEIKEDMQTNLYVTLDTASLQTYNHCYAKLFRLDWEYDPDYMMGGSNVMRLIISDQ